MAVVKAWETADGRGVSGAARESLEYTRTWAVKVDAPDTPLVDIFAATGVVFGQLHPEDYSVYANSFDCSATGDLMLYTVSVKYRQPEAKDADEEQQGDYNYQTMPRDQWSGSASVAAVPITVDKDGNPIKNTAGQPIPSLQADHAFGQLTLVRSYASLAAVVSDLNTYTNTVNSDTWAGGGPRTWKCQGCNWQKVTQSTDGASPLIYYQVSWTFAYDSREWIIEQVNVGYMETDGSGGLRPIKMGDPEENVSEPVPLDEHGYAFRAGGGPITIKANIYQERAFGSKFGTPS